MVRIWTLNWRSYNILLDIQTRIPPKFKPCFIQEPVILTDAIGRVAPVHLEFINSWEALDSVLAVRFRNIPGERKIREKEYALQDRGSLCDLERTTSFEACFIPGGHVDMAMIFQSMQGRGNSCPGCGKESDGMQSAAIIWYVINQRVAFIGRLGLLARGVAYGFNVWRKLSTKPRVNRWTPQLTHVKSARGAITVLKRHLALPDPGRPREF
jgi:hypothetical protein